MPTILHLGGLRVVIYPNDHRPAHVHVRGSGVEAVFLLNCPDGPPELRESLGFNRRRLSQVKQQLTGVVTSLCVEWSQLHGRF